MFKDFMKQMNVLSNKCMPLKTFFLVSFDKDGVHKIVFISSNATFARHTRMLN